MEFVQNTSLHRDIENHPELAKRLAQKYPDRFPKLAEAAAKSKPPKEPVSK